MCSVEEQVICSRFPRGWAPAIPQQGKGQNSTSNCCEGFQEEYIRPDRENNSFPSVLSGWLRPGVRGSLRGKTAMHLPRMDAKALKGGDE